MTMSKMLNLAVLRDNPTFTKHHGSNLNRISLQILLETCGREVTGVANNHPQKLISNYTAVCFKRTLRCLQD